MLPALAPELLPLEATPQDPGWHPEGDVWVHTLQVVDEAAALLDDLGDDRPRQLAVMLGALCHDLGKPGTTTRDEDGRIRSRGHEEAGLPPTTALLDRWNVHTLLGYDVRSQVLALVAHHLKPGLLYDDRDRVSDGAIRRLARKVEPDLLYRVAKADCLGRRPGAFEPVAMEWFRERVRELDVAVRPPEPILQGAGRHRPRRRRRGPRSAASSRPSTRSSSTARSRPSRRRGPPRRAFSTPKPSLGPSQPKSRSSIAAAHSSHPPRGSSLP